MLYAYSTATAQQPHLKEADGRSRFVVGRKIICRSVHVVLIALVKTSATGQSPVTWGALLRVV